MDLKELLQFHQQMSEEGRILTAEIRSLMNQKRPAAPVVPTRRVELPWLTSREVEKVMSISPRKLQTLRSNGRLKYSAIDGSYYYKMADIEALLESGYDAKTKANAKT
ncbi:MAG: helix-turn-helix domain-containing protein [Bacteroidales bacterium]